jgi:hypothetical protein
MTSKNGEIVSLAGLWIAIIVSILLLVQQRSRVGLTG